MAITQPWLIRLLHWGNVVVLAVMAGSGLQILSAYPSFGPRGDLAHWYPFQGQKPPAALTIGGWLAGARAYHFAFAWPLVVSGAIYVVHLFASGEFRRRLFSPRRDAIGAAQMFAYYLRLRRDPPKTDLYNPLQRFAYTNALALAVVSVVTGLVMYKPVQFPVLAYDTARALHFLSLCALALFTVVHVVMVLLHPRSLRAMTVGHE